MSTLMVLLRILEYLFLFREADLSLGSLLSRNQSMFGHSHTSSGRTSFIKHIDMYFSTIDQFGVLQVYQLIISNNIWGKNSFKLSL